MSRNRLLLTDRADMVRVALFAHACAWEVVSGPHPLRWRTPFGLLVTVTQDELLQVPTLELVAESTAAKAEAAALVEELPRIINAVRHSDILVNLEKARSEAARGRLLPLLAATLSEGDAPGRRRLLGAVAAALTGSAGDRRAGAVLATAYLDDVTLSARVRALASGDPDPKVRELARRVVDARPPIPGGTRRIAFVAERVRDEFLPFAADQGWTPVEHRPGGADDSERFVWRTEPGVEIVLVADIRLDREFVVLGAVQPLEHREVDRIEAVVRDRFATADLDEVLGVLDDEPEAAGKLIALRVAIAAAPASYQPRFLGSIVDVLASSVAPLRGFAAGASIYYPWTEVVPFLTWIAEHDREPTVRVMALAGLAAVDRAHGDRLAELLPTTRYYTTSDGQPELVRRVHLVPVPVDQRLGDGTWRRTRLPDVLPPSYHEVTFAEAGAIAAGQWRVR